MGSAHPTWLERATPDELKEITEIDRSIADLRRRRSIPIDEHATLVGLHFPAMP